MSTQAREHLPHALETLQEMIDQAPEPPAIITTPTPARRDVLPTTKLPKRYRDQWERPKDSTWLGNFERTLDKVSQGGLVALIGPRGTGKTRLAAEVMRNLSPDAGHYTTAMALFLRIRASFAKTSKESEESIVQDLGKAPLLILDEIQERGNSAWEDRILTHILDRRYGEMLGAIVIANLAEKDLKSCLGDSIISRLMETGGILEIAGPSYRAEKGGKV